MALTTKELNKTKNNPRQITDGRLEQLNENLTEYGDLSGIVYNTKLKQLVTGNQRTTLFNLKSQNDIEYIEQYENPKQDGTKAYGFIVANGQKFTYREVEWAKDKHTKAVVLANTHAGEWDLEMLKMPDFEVANDILLDFDILSFDMPDDLGEYESEGDNSKSTPNIGQNESPYSTKIEAPIYEAKNEKPQIQDLYKNERFSQLIEEVENSVLTKEEKEFLKLAAVRHIVFNYELIADFYAHSSKECQELMENSALVIIDFNKAIELGYVKLKEETANLYKEQYIDYIEDEQ